MREFLFKFSILLFFLSVLSAFASAQGCHDLTTDNTVNIFDLVFVATHIGSVGGSADLDSSGLVDVADLVVIAQNFGMCAGLFECDNGIDDDEDGLVDWQYDLGCSGPEDTTEQALSREEEDGWTTFDPVQGTDHDTQIIFVSSNDPDADNANCAGYTADDLTTLDSLEDIVPCETIAQGLSLLNNGNPDWLLLKRGDEWNESLGEGEGKNGRSVSEPMIFATYGLSQTRPLLKTPAHGLDHYNGYMSYVSFVGIKFQPNLYTGNERLTGIRFAAPSEYILIEDCYFDGYKINVRTIFGNNVTIRRNIIADAYAGEDHSQGIFSGTMENYIIEENVIVHNGWKEDVLGMEDTEFNHNIYLSSANNSNVIIRNNILAQASSHGIEIKGGENVTIINNSFIQNALGVLLGSYERPSGSDGKIEDNVFIETKTINGESRGWAVEIQNSKPGIGVSVKRNIFAHATIGSLGPAFWPQVGRDEGDPTSQVGINEVIIENNIIYDWKGMNVDELFVPGSTGRTAFNNFTMKNNNFQDFHYNKNFDYAIPYQTSNGYWENNNYFTNDAGVDTDKWFRIDGEYKTFDEWQTEESEDGTPKFEGSATNNEINYLDPDRSVGSYHASIDGSATTEAFLQEARMQSKFNWRPEYTAAEFNEYIRDGFAVFEP